MASHTTATSSIEDLQLYTVEEVAALMKVSERHLYNLVRKRQIPHCKPNGVSIRFTEADIREAIRLGHRPVVQP